MLQFDPVRNLRFWSHRQEELIVLRITVCYETILLGRGGLSIMKSLGERLVAGLRNWRSRKKGAASDETPDVERVASESLEQSYNTQPEKLSINITTTNPEEADTNTFA